MGGVTDTQSLRYGYVTDVITHAMVANLADDIAAQLDAADIARTKALKRPEARAQRSATLSIPVNTITPIPFDTIAYDTHGMIDLVGQPNRVTVVSAAGIGVYWARAQVSVDTTGWTKGDILLYKNGAFGGQKTSWGPQSFNGGPSGEFIVPMTAVGDYFEIRLYHEGGGTTTLFDTQFWVRKVSEF